MGSLAGNRSKSNQPGTTETALSRDVLVVALILEGFMLGLSMIATDGGLMFKSVTATVLTHAIGILLIAARRGRNFTRTDDLFATGGFFPLLILAALFSLAWAEIASRAGWWFLAEWR